jgi:methylglutamate dehydrogenase subunit D
MADGAPFTLHEESCHLVQADGWADRLAAFEATLKAALGMAMPEAVGEMQRGAGVTAIRIAPRRFWLLYDTTAPSVAVDPELGCRFALGEGRVRLHLAGFRLPNVLEKCVAVDWNAVTTTPLRAIHTSLHGVPVLLMRRAELECDLLVPRSFARSVVEWVVDAAREFTRSEP